MKMFGEYSQARWSTWAVIGLCAVAIAGCGGSSRSGRPTGQTCANPSPREVQQHTVISALPNSYDRERTDDATESETTTVYVSVFLPERCPGDRFPVVLQGHGYGGSRETELDDDGEVDPEVAHFAAINELFRGLPFHGYIGVSIEQRGHGDSIPENGGGYARIIDPQAETQDTVAVLDWIYGKASDFQVQLEAGSEVPEDFKVGLIGYSYGGGFQFPLALLDARVDTIVPNGTWHSLMNSLLPGNAVKNGFDGLLCLLADTGGVVNTPLVATMCDLVGYDNLQAGTIRTREDLVAAMAADGYTEDELVKTFDRHVRDLELRQVDMRPWCTPGDTGCTSNGEPFVGRSVPTLLLQGNRDVLFNLTEAYWNWAYFRGNAAAGVPVKVLSTEGGHMNPLANQVEGTANCGKVIGVDAVRAWLDFHLRGIDSVAYRTIPGVCISVADTTDAQTAAPAGLILPDFPVGSLSGPGAVPARVENVTASVAATDTSPVFVPLTTIAGDNKAIAGIPSLDSITVTDSDAGGVGDVTAVAYAGVAIQRDGSLILIDDELTAVVAGTHTANPNLRNDRYLMPGVGELLQDGDVVGLAFYQHHVQYSAVVSAELIPGATGLVGFVAGQPLPPLLSALSPVTGLLNSPNPYDVEIRGAELPILDVTAYPGAVLSR